MFGLQKHGPDGRYGVVMDIGSGSVTIAIVSSDPLQDLPTVVWNHKERLSLEGDAELTTVAKNIASATMNAILTCGSEGMRALRDYDSRAQLPHVEVTVSAPWSYTITRTVSSSSQTPFLITKAVIEELVTAAQKQALELLNENELFEKLGLEVVANSTVDISLNGYSVRNALGQKVEKIVISRLIGVVQRQLEQVITESVSKVLPDAALRIHTFMYQFAITLLAIDPNDTELCLVDIGGEATEIGIVRDGVLRYVTHQPIGHNSLARSLAKITDSPHEEVLQALKNDFVTFVAAFGKEKQTAINDTVASYIAELADLFGRTGDTLSIPKSIYVHCDTGFDEYFVAFVGKASQAATKIEHNVRSITNTIFTAGGDSEIETKILLSSYVFHKKLIDTHLTTN